jgi:nuclear pore complex protein Nup98-Nup96
VLERPGYFTIPSLSDLAAMTDTRTGDCHVENFAIGRVDFGCITFPGVTNLTGLNLDEVVHIRRREVHVYPDEARKPPVGTGLNRAAEITLHRVWPTDKRTRAPLTDPHLIVSMGYGKKIERATGEMGAQFVDYDPLTGSWTFKVKHFSKYGLADSDDEDEDQEEGQGVLQHQPPTAVKTFHVSSRCL